MKLNLQLISNILLNITVLKQQDYVLVGVSAPKAEW